MLQLLGLSDQDLQEQMAKGHSYAFNMGNNNIIPFQDFQEAAKVLMERNTPEVLHNMQRKILHSLHRCSEASYPSQKTKAACVQRQSPSDFSVLRR